jgi:hypothetical protein
MGGSRGRIRWLVIDRALAGYSAVSLLSLFSAAIDSPYCRSWERQLAAVWARSLRRPPPGAALAAPVDLVRLVSEAERAVPSYPAMRELPAADPRNLVRFEVAGRRFRIHPGDYVYPLVTLRALAATAAAVDPVIYDLHGFTLTDVMELVLAHADRALAELADCWPPRQMDDVPALVVTGAEVEVASAILADDINCVIPGCSDPGRASAALTWLTRPAAQLSVSSSPDLPLLGACLAVDSGARRVPVPAALTLSTLSAAARRLTGEAARRPLARARMHAITGMRTWDLFARRLPPDTAWPSGAPSTASDTSSPVAEEQSAPSSRRRQRVLSAEPAIFDGPHFAGAVVAGLSSKDLNQALDRADACLAKQQSPEPDGRQPEGPGRAQMKLVVYGGPALVRFHEVTDTIRVHVEELAEIFAGAAGDQGMVAAFLAELAAHPGVDAVLVADVLDAWCAWRTDGYLILPLPPEPGTAVAVLDPRADPTWQRAVAWEPVDRILTAAGLPGSVDWPIAQLVEDGAEADLFSPGDGLFAQVKLEPPVLILAKVADAEALGLSHDMLFGLADGIRITAGRHADIAAHLRLSDELPLTLRLRLRLERTPDQHEGIQVGFAVSPSTGVTEIAVGPDTVELLQADGREGHSIFGMVIYKAVERLRAERGDATGVAEDRFMAAWNSCPPLIIIGFSESFAPTVAPADILPRGPHIHSQVLRQLAGQLRRRGVPAGTFSGAEARRVCRDHLLPAMCELLRARIEELRPELVDQTLRCLSGAHAERRRRHRAITRALGGQFADNWIEQALHDHEGPALTRPLEVLLEFLLAYPPAGREQASLMDVAELADLAEYLLVTASHLRAADNDLYDLTVIVLAEGIFTVEEQPARIRPALDVGFDGAAYMRACRRHRVAMALANGPPQPSAAVTLPVGTGKSAPAPFKLLADFADPRLVQADALLHDTLGTGIDGIHAVLNAATDWPVGKDGFARTDRAQLAEEAARGSGLPPADIQAAIGSLVLHGQDLRPLEGTRIAELETRGYRLGIRPLPVIDGKIVVVPWLAHIALDIYVAYIADRRFPYPHADLPPQAAQVMAQDRRKLDNELERVTRAEVSAAGLPHRFRLTPEEATAAGIAGLTGEIDLLIADPDNSRLWVCEAKNPYPAFSSRTIAKHIERFTKKGGYIDKLLGKAETIARHAQLAAALCQVRPERPWRVIPLIVTPAVEPTAFVTEPRVPFTVVTSLAPILRAADDPASGFVTGAADLPDKSPDSPSELAIHRRLPSNVIRCGGAR